MRRPAHVWSGGTLFALSATVGVLVGLRSIAHVELPRLEPLLGLDAIPREALGVAWSARALWPADLQAGALERLLVGVAVLFLTAALVATLNAVILLAESAASRRAELAVRSAMGASPIVLARMMVGELRTLLTGGAALGLLLGLFGGGLARALWPALLLDVTVSAPWDLLLGLGSITLLLIGARFWGGWQMARPDRAAVVLRAGTRTGADPMAVFVRKVLTATHATVAGTVLVGTMTLAGALADAGTDAVETGGTVLFGVTSPEPRRWSDLLAETGEIPGIEAESLAAPGALLDLGIREVATAECGNCWRSLMPAPLWNALADHHAVAPGYFGLAGVEIVAGRDFTAADAADAEPVVLLSETFARTSFEMGEPIGKRVRVGSDFANWYTVIGIVEDGRIPILGADETAREVVFMSALQQPPRTGTLLLRGSDEALDEAEVVMTEMGFSPGVGQSLAQYRTEATRTLEWAHGVAAVIALLALVLAAHGVYATALQTTRRRTGELAIRRAVGATSGRLVAYVLVERLRITAWGLAGFAFFGTFVVALLQNAAGMPPAAPTAYAGIGALLLGVGLVASSRAAREALSVEPGTILE